MAKVSIDIPRVRGKMAERGYTITSLSNRLGISRNTLSAYFDNPWKIPYSIVSDMAVVLCDSADEAVSIFFATDLRKTKDLVATSAQSSA